MTASARRSCGLSADPGRGHGPPGTTIGFTERPLGRTTTETHGTAVPEETRAALGQVDGWLLGPHDSAAYPEPHKSALNPSGTIRKHFCLFANIRPAKAFPGGNATEPTWDIAGQNVANPIVGILSSSMLLRWLGAKFSDDKVLRAAEPSRPDSGRHHYQRPGRHGRPPATSSMPSSPHHDPHPRLTRGQSRSFVGRLSLAPTISFYRTGPTFHAGGLF